MSGLYFVPGLNQEAGIMAQAIRIYTQGDADVFRYENISVGAPGLGEIKISQTAIGLNFIDVYHRNGLYPITLPGIIGMEGAGVVIEVGADVAGLKTGDRVAYASGPLGAYASERIMPTARVVKLPDFLQEKTAAAIMVKGMTAEFLLRRTYPVKAGDTILIHAAAGGVGTILTQWAKHLGAVVIATAGSAEKCARVRHLGADHVIDYRAENFKEAVRDYTNGAGVHAVYDGVGAQTFLDSIDCLRPLGMMVSFGNASGPPPAIEPRMLASKGSLFLTRPSLAHYTARPEDYAQSAAALFAVLEAGGVKQSVPKTYALSDAAQAHRDLESRAITGSAILLP